MYTMNFFLFLFIICSALSLIDAQNLGVLYAQSSAHTDKNGSFCIIYNPKFKPLDQSLDVAVFHGLVNLSSEYMCNDTTGIPSLANKVAFVLRGNCSFSDKAYNVQKLGAVALVVLSSHGMPEPAASEESDYDEIHISVSVMDAEDFDTIMALGDDVQVKLFSPPVSRIDWNMVIIWIVATGTVTAGAFWSGVGKHKKLMGKKGNGRPARTAVNVDAEDTNNSELIDVSPTTMIMFVLMMCLMLVSLYFLYDYLVYLVIALFTVAACSSLFFCIQPLWNKITCFGACRIPANKIPFFKYRPEVRSIILYMICAAVAVTWAIERNKSYAWIVQDLLGIAFCLNTLKSVQLPSLMGCTILLVQLFVYDIFFVFITPLFTKSGESIMVEVATGSGGTSGEMLPMVLKVPRIEDSQLSVCRMPFSLLGFGDIIVPGLLVSYCYGFDLKVGSKRVYFISSVIAYGVGLIMTFIALAVMNQGQPALLYLVPCTLLTTFCVAGCRREFRHIWSGKMNEENVLSSGPKTDEEQNIQDENSYGASIQHNDDSDSEQPLISN